MEIPFNLLILPFLGGYIFVRFWNYTRIHTMRSDKDRNVIRASIAGLFALTAAYALSIIGAYLFPCEKYCIPTMWKELVPFEYSGISATAFLIAALGWFPLNKWRFKIEDEIDRAIKEDADPLELLLKQAKDENLAVSVTMTNEKVYIGRVLHPFNPATPTKNIALLPLQSGYRDSVTKEMHLRINYSQVISRLTAELDRVSEDIYRIEQDRVNFLRDNSTNERTRFDESLDELKARFEILENRIDAFILVIPASQIASASIFDSDVYNEYFPPESQESA